MNTKFEIDLAKLVFSKQTNFANKKNQTLLKSPWNVVENCTDSKDFITMYNGIGLSTVRGSGTNGYVQRNLSHIRPSKDKINYKTEEDIQKAEAQISRGPNQGILDHERKRKLEVKCLELEDVLRDQGLDDDEVTEKVHTYRQMLLGT